MSLDRNSRTVWTSEHGQVAKSSSQGGKKGKKQKQKSANLSGAGFPKDGVTRVRRETGGKGGKTVTAIYGLPGSDADRKDLLKQLKQTCGCGGAVKPGHVEIQGDHRDKIVAYLQEQGLTVKVAGG